MSHISSCVIRNLGYSSNCSKETKLCVVEMSDLAVASPKIFELALFVEIENPTE